MVSNKGAMQRHVNMVHLNLKLFQCEACPKALKCARSLRRHLVTKHGYVLDEKEMNQIEKDVERQQIVKPVETKCLKCDSNQFKDEFEFDNHVVICYGKTLNTSIEFKCNQCNSKWNSAEVLHFHLFHKHKVGDCVCDICGSIIKSYHYLQRHKVTNSIF